MIGKTGRPVDMKGSRSRKSLDRRTYLATVGATLCGASLFAITAAGKDSATAHQGHIDLQENDNGVLITTTHPHGLSKQDIRSTRDEFLQSRVVGADKIPLTNMDDTSTNFTQNSIVGYYLGLERDSPIERFWSDPSPPSLAHRSNSREDRERTVKRAKEYVSTKSGGYSVQSSASGVNPLSVQDDPIDASPSWKPRATVTNDTNVWSLIGDDNIYYVLGRIDLTARLYEAEEVNGMSQYGCVLSFTQWPGDYLDENGDVVNGSGFNRRTHLEQDWTVSGANLEDLELIDFAPLDNSSVFGGVDLDSVSFGASASGPYGEITLSPSEGTVNNIENKTSPDEAVRTEYSYGSFYDQADLGGDSVVQAGNSGVFLWDGGHNIVTTGITGHFEAREEGEVVQENERVGHGISQMSIDR